MQEPQHLAQTALAYAAQTCCPHSTAPLGAAGETKQIQPRQTVRSQTNVTASLWSSPNMINHTSAGNIDNLFPATSRI